jgi:hypothetical protein
MPLLVGCGGAAGTPAITAPTAGEAGGALVDMTVDPPSPQPVPAFDGIQLYERLIELGFTADETRFVSCHGWRYGSPVKRECDVEVIGSGSSAETLQSAQGFEDGRSPKDDAPTNAKLAAIGYPAPPGKWPYPDLVVVMRRVQADAVHGEHVDVAVREQTTGAEYPAGDIPAETGEDHVYPRAVVLSPRGTFLAVVVAESDGKALRLEHLVMRANVAAANGYAYASERARSPPQAEALRAKARAVRAHDEAR